MEMYLCILRWLVIKKKINSDNFWHLDVDFAWSLFNKYDLRNSDILS